MAPKPSRTIDNAVMRKKLNSPPSPTWTEPKSITGLPPAKVAVRPPKNSKIQSQPGIEGSTPRGIRAMRAAMITSTATAAMGTQPG